ncbi:hypothetical protein BDE36_0071 [Arcticibacter tournemirensis]|nr:hypothetical protein BDE36_0071 [Arcticibacter tournemirensis]
MKGGLYAEHKQYISGNNKDRSIPGAKVGIIILLTLQNDTCISGYIFTRRSKL